MSVGPHSTHVLLATSPSAHSGFSPDPEEATVDPHETKENSRSDNRATARCCMAMRCFSQRP